MKSIIVIAILFAAATGAAAQDKKENSTTSDATSGPPQSMKIPKEAVLNPDGRTYSYTDKEGKKWTYLRTPFGITRVAAKDQPAAPPAAARKVDVIDKGDTVRFERQSPFGPMGWEKKKSELTDEERRMYEASKTEASNARTQQNGKTQ
jgi:hypothetical protein